MPSPTGSWRDDGGEAERESGSARYGAETEREVTVHVAGLSLPLVFAAGLVSFISPCVLPLVPGYVSTISGVSLEQLAGRERGINRRIAVASLLFFAGFLAVFVALGASASVVGAFLIGRRLLLNRIAGGLIVVFGLA